MTYRIFIILAEIIAIQLVFRIYAHFTEDIFKEKVANIIRIFLTGLLVITLLITVYLKWRQ